jgi:HSF-type DNA-binding
MDAPSRLASKTAAAVEFEDLFPAKLHYVLEQAERDGRADVIAWRPHGKAFVVKDKREFVASFLPKYVLSCTPSAFGFVRQRACMFVQPC